MAIDRKHHALDAADLIAGRFATKIATLLQGKHKVSWMPHIDGGDFVSVMNISKLRFSGAKLTKKFYHRFTGYPGGIRTVRLDAAFAKDPGLVLKRMVYAMLPKNKLRSRMITRLRFSKEK